METALSSSTSKYDFLPGKHICRFIEEPKIFTSSVQEFYVDSNNLANCDYGIRVPGEVSDQERAGDSVELKKQKDQKSFIDTGKVFDQEREEDSVDEVLKKQKEEKLFLDIDKVLDEEKTEDSIDMVLEKQEEETFTENERGVFTEFKFLHKYDLSNEVPRLSAVNSEFDTIGSNDGFLKSNDKIELDSYELLSERDFSEGLGTESLEAISEKKVESILDHATSVTIDEAFDSDDEYIELQPESPSSSVLDEEIWSMEEDIIHAEEKHEEEDLFHKEAEPADSHRISEGPQLENSGLNEAEDNEEEDYSVNEHPVYSAVNFEESSMEENESISDSDDQDDDDDLEFASGHDDIIEQLKMELQNARTGGLPTILEDSESPLKMMDELKPLKIDQTFQHKDCMIEIHKFYRSYLDKMRKLDILNSQAMHAVGKLNNNSSLY